MTKLRRLSLVNLEKSFQDTIGSKIINNMAEYDGRDINDYVKSMFTDISKEIGFAASCECGDYVGNIYEGHHCPNCQSQVSTMYSTELANTQWIAVPDYLPCFIHPIFYLILRSWLGRVSSTKNNRKNKIPIIQAILDPKSELPDNLKPIIEKQGFKYFYENHERIMEHFFAISEGSRVSKGNKSKIMGRYVKYVYEKHKDKLFTRVLPILHSSLHPVTKEGRVKGIDESAAIILPTIVDLSSLIYSHKRNITPKQYVSTKLWNVYQNYILYVENILTRKLSEKPSQFRRHNIGTRSHFSARAVIVPRVGRHEGDEISLPYKMVVEGMKYEIFNILVNRQNYTYANAHSKILSSLTNFDEEIYSILQLLIEESEFKGIPCRVGRNPTLLHGSIQLLFCDTIKRDIDDQTICLSPRICGPLNADFDGDEVHLGFIKEKEMVYAMRYLHPKHMILSKSSFSISSLIVPTEQAVLHMNHFLRDDQSTDVEFYDPILSKYGAA